jgi:hypothetical protein
VVVGAAVVVVVGLQDAPISAKIYSEVEVTLSNRAQTIILGPLFTRLLLIVVPAQLTYEKGYDSLLSVPSSA